MRKQLIAIAASVLASSGAWAGKHHPMTEAEQVHCLMTDGNEAGEVWCIKSDVGMTKAQIDAYFMKEGERAYAPYIAGYKNCLRETEDAKRLGGWYGKPSAEDCLAWSNAVIAKGRDMIDKGIKGLMETK